MEGKGRGVESMRKEMGRRMEAMRKEEGRRRWIPGSKRKQRYAKEQ